MPAQTIDDVIQDLTRIVAICQEKENRLGYFPALYRKVTIKVKEGIAAGLFEDGPRMERLDVIFANRYLEAYERFEREEVPTQSWSVALAAAADRWPLVLQHLFLGMNAHINLDLGIAAALAAPGNDLASLQNDFNKINHVLASLVDDVKDEMMQIWPGLKLLNYIPGRDEDELVNFSMLQARNQAWRVAQMLAPLSSEEQLPVIAQIDHEIAVFAKIIQRPGLLTNLVCRLIRLRERGSTAQIIGLLT